MTQKELNKQLVSAAQSGNVADVRSALEAGADVNVKGPYDWTSLMEAAEYGDIAMIKLLLEYGADPDIRDNEGNTALMNACYGGYTETVELLLNCGVDPNIRNKDGATAFIHATWHGHTETSRLLLKYKADIDMADSRGDTPLMIACKNPDGKRDLITMLITAGANLEKINNCGMTALMYLARNGYTGLMKLLIKDGADMNIKDAQGRTALDILWEFHPEKYDKWIKRATIKAKKKTLKREDSTRSRGCTPDFEI